MELEEALMPDKPRPLHPMIRDHDARPAAQCDLAGATALVGPSWPPSRSA